MSLLRSLIFDIDHRMTNPLLAIMPVFVFLQMIDHGGCSFFCIWMGNKAYADPSQQSCQTYVRCVGGHATRTQCPTPQFYNHTYGGCMDPPDFSCDSGLGPHLKLVPGMDCTIPGKVLPAAFSCSEFFLCLNNTWTHIDCPPGAIFNTKTWKCQVPHVCDPRSISKLHTRYKGGPDSSLKVLPLIIAKNKPDSHGPYANICTEERVNKELIADPYYCQNFLFCHKRPELTVKNGSKPPKTIMVDKVGLQMYSCPPGKLFHLPCADCRKAKEVDCGSRHRFEDIYGENPYAENIPDDLKCERSWTLRKDNTILFRELTRPIEPDGTSDPLETVTTEHNVSTETPFSEDNIETSPEPVKYSEVSQSSIENVLKGEMNDTFSGADGTSSSSSSIDAAIENEEEDTGATVILLMGDTNLNSNVDQEQNPVSNANDGSSGINDSSTKDRISLNGQGQNSTWNLEDDDDSK